MGQRIVNEWIDVKEKLPECDQDILVCGEDKSIYLSNFKHGHFFSRDCSHGLQDPPPKVIAWMPLPKPYVRPPDLVTFKSFRQTHKLVRNRIKCLDCDDIIESTWVHDFKYCKCGKAFVDGGLEYCRCGHENLDRIEDLSEWKEI